MTGGRPSTPGLKGHLEDLALLDMLQIVAFSKKTGFLEIESALGKGGIVFREGLVVCAYSWSTLRYLRQIGDEPEGRYSTDILQKHIEISLQELASLREGRFHFQVTDSVPATLGGMKITPFLLHQGINPEALLLDLAKEMDEERRETCLLLETAAIAPASVEPPAPELTPEEAPLPSPPPKPAETRAEEPETSVLLVDDEPPVTQVVGAAMREAGYRVYTASSPLEAAGMASEIALAGERLVVVTDLGMPTSNGRSFRGGFELVRLLKGNGVEAPVLMMMERLPEKARARVRALGVRRVALKPTLSKLDPKQYENDLRTFASTVLGLLDNLGAAAAAPDAEPPREAGGEDKTSAPFLEYIASMTTKLLDPRRSVEVSQMVLQVASKYLERAVLFLIKGERACGVGGIGLASTEEVSSQKARSIQFNIQQARPFAEVVYSGRAERYRSDQAWLEAGLYAVIGKARAGEFVLMPMLNNGEVLVVLYGDNGWSGRPVGKARGLELFLAQAGMVLENTFLHQKLRVFESKLTRGTSGGQTTDVRRG